MNKADTDELLNEVRKEPGITKAALAGMYKDPMSARHTIAVLIKSGRLVANKGAPRSAQLFLGAI